MEWEKMELCEDLEIEFVRDGKLEETFFFGLRMALKPFFGVEGLHLIRTQDNVRLASLAKSISRLF